MARFWLPFFTLSTLQVCVPSQPSIDLLNQFCAISPQSPGCEGFDVGVGPGGVASSTGGQTSCPASSRSCPELPTFCVPRAIPCSIIGSGRSCRFPEDQGYKLQVLLCGDGTNVGIRCGNGSTVPVLTQLLVQCQGANHDSIGPVTGLGIVSKPGKYGAAGIYRCDIRGSWEPLFGSPDLLDLTSSCNKSGCGSVPQSDERAPVYRRWSWVRAIYYEGRIQCTATLVTPTAVLTAAHCLTVSLVSRQARSPSEFQLELPGPNNAIRRITVMPNAIHIHPGYNPQMGRQHDLALMFFKELTEYTFPVICISDSPLPPSSSRLQVVFSLEPTTERGKVVPGWRNSRASWDASCRSVDTRTSFACRDSLVVQPSQFCATHPEVSMVQGSSGGPYLVEVGEGVEEVWMVAGVLSHSSEQDCGEKHSVYSLVAEDSAWTRNCLFEGRCN